jgi:hypothetical protein
MNAPKTILIGDRVRYESAAGAIRGVVTLIEYEKNAAGYIIPWIVVEYQFNSYTKIRTRLADTSLAMMKFEVIFRDIPAKKVA